MPDVFTKKKRSQVMGAVRSRGNKSTEIKLASIFRAHGITGWRRHQSLPGKPDFAFRRERVVVFVDGCFWHGCRLHCRFPRGNKRYWQKKILGNASRDLQTKRTLRKMGWRVLRIWEHSLGLGEPLVVRIKSELRIAVRKGNNDRT